MKKITLFLGLVLTLSVFAKAPDLHSPLVDKIKITPKAIGIKGFLINKETGERIFINNLTQDWGGGVDCGYATYNVTINYVNGCNYSFTGSITINTCQTNITEAISNTAKSVYDSNLAGSEGCPQVPQPDYTASY